MKKETYRIDTGDTNTGTAGFVAYIDAASRTEALEKLRARVDVDGYKVEDSDGLSVIVFLNPANVKVGDVEREDGTAEDENGNEIEDTTTAKGGIS